MFNRKAGFITAAIVVAVLIAAALIYNFTLNKDTESFGESSFPQTLQGLSLAQVVSGPQAIGMISKLHGSDIAIKQGYIATYQGNQAQIMIWVSESHNEKEAVQLFDIMDEKIIAAGTGSGQAPFTDRRQLNVNNKNVIAVKGMGMENYYYQIGDKVYWVAAGGIDPVKTLEAVMKAI